MDRLQIINILIEERRYKSYLEIGLDDPSLNFVNINCEIKESVDPYDHKLRFCTQWNDSNLKDFLKYLTYRMTSDEFFENYPDKKYDMIFIDGLHLEEQCDRDIRNALLHLNNGGIVVVHDCLPKNERSQYDTPPQKGVWMGTVWKTMVKYAQNTNLDIKIINSDSGIGLIEYSDNLDFTIPAKLDMDYSFFAKNKYDILNIYKIE